MVAIRNALYVVCVFAMSSAWGCMQSGANGLGTDGLNLRWPTALGTSNNKADWTLLCCEIDDTVPDRRERIEEYAEGLRKTGISGSNKVVVRHDQDASRIYCGTFQPSMANGTPDFSSRELALAERIRSLAVGSFHPFLQVRFVPSPTPDVGPPEWNIKRCEGPYTLGVAEFYNTGDFRERKNVAVQYCGMLREKGYEAYYWHGPTRSMVCVFSLQLDRDFTIRPDGIVLKPELRKTVESDPELKFKTVNGRYVSQRIYDTSVRQRAVPIPCPDRPAPSNEEWLRQGKLSPIRRR